MANYDGKYVKVHGDPTYWAVDDGERYRVSDREEMYQIGLRKLSIITKAALKAIPIKGAKKQTKGKGAGA